MLHKFITGEFYAKVLHFFGELARQCQQCCMFLIYQMMLMRLKFNVHRKFSWHAWNRRVVMSRKVGQGSIFGPLSPALPFNKLGRMSLVGWKVKSDWMINRVDLGRFFLHVEKSSLELIFNSSIVFYCQVQNSEILLIHIIQLRWFFFSCGCDGWKCVSSKLNAASKCF